MFTLKKYNTIEEIMQSAFSSEEEPVSLEELSDSEVVGLTGSNEEITITFEQQKQGLEEQGYWGWIDEENTIHYWMGKEIELEELIHFFAHEVGHRTGTPLEDGFDEEMRAEDFGSVATMAYKLAKQISKTN
jgi:hypothetical protein